MSNRRFCDLCDTLLTPEDDKPFIRYHLKTPIQIALIAMFVDGQSANDVCIQCRIDIVTGGQVEKPEYSTPVIREHSNATTTSGGSMGGTGKLSGGAQPANVLLPFEPSVKEKDNENLPAEAGDSQPHKAEGEQA